MKNTGYTYQVKRSRGNFCQLVNKGLVSYGLFFQMELEALE